MLILSTRKNESTLKDVPNATSIGLNYAAILLY